MKAEADGHPRHVRGRRRQGRAKEQLFDRVLVVGRPAAELEDSRARQHARQGRTSAASSSSTSSGGPTSRRSSRSATSSASRCWRTRRRTKGASRCEVIAGENVAFAPRAIPAVVFTDPELAWCGLTEAQAAKEGRKVTIAKFPWGASGRAITLDRTDGLTKLILDPDDRTASRRRPGRPRRRRADRRRRAGDRDGRERDRPEAVDPPAPDADRNDDGVGRSVLRPGDARLPAEARLRS